MVPLKAAAPLEEDDMKSGRWRLMAAAILVVAGLGLFVNFNTFGQGPVTIEAESVAAAPEIAPASTAENPAPAPAEGRDAWYWLGIAAAIFLAIYPLIRYLVPQPYRAVLDAWAGIIQQLKIAKDPKTVKDLLGELQKLEPKMDKKALAIWKKTTARAKKKAEK